MWFLPRAGDGAHSGHKWTEKGPSKGNREVFLEEEETDVLEVRDN